MPASDRACALRTKATWAEKLVWRWLRDRRFSQYKFRRQHPIKTYVLDFFCEEAHLSIELDGSGHGHPARQAIDLERTRQLAALGIKELRFWNHQLRREAASVRDTIFRELQERAPHPLPEYTRPLIQSQIAKVEGIQMVARPHPGPLPRGEGECGDPLG